MLDEETLDRIEIRTGIHPQELTELVRADYGPDRIVWLVRGAPNVAALVKAAQMRMNSVTTQSDSPVLRRDGYIGGRLRSWAALSDDTLLVAGGHTETEVSAIIAASQRGLAPDPDEGVRASCGRPPRDWRVDVLPAPAAGGYVLADTLALWEAHRERPFVVLMPAPLDPPRDAAIGVLLARQEQLALSASPEGGYLSVKLTLNGEFPPGIAENLRQLFEALSSSDLGSSLALDHAVESLAIESEAGMVRAHWSWPNRPLARGLRLLLSSDAWGLIEHGVVP